MCRNFKVKFGTLSQPEKSGLVSSENRFKASQRKDSYGTILTDVCRAVGVKSCSKLGAISRPYAYAILVLEKFKIEGHYSKLFGVR